MKILAYLMVWVYQSVGNDYVFFPSSCEDDHLCNVIWGQWITPSMAQHISTVVLENAEYVRIDRICLRLVPVEPDNAELSFHLPGIPDLEASP